MTSELLPCPFCGGKAEMRIEDLYEDQSYGRRAWVRCKDCGGRVEFEI